MASSICSCTSSEVEEFTSTTTDSESHTRTVSLLEKLKAPKHSDLTRKRAVDQNLPPKDKRSHGAQPTDPKSVSATQRVSEFSNENLTVSNSKMFCRACREELALKKNVISNHVHSAKHQAGKSRLVAKEAKEKDIAEALIATDQQCHLVGETIPLDHRIYRVKVVKSFIRAAVPLSKLETFRELLEENAYRLIDLRHMSDLVPLVFSQEIAQIKEEIAKHPVSVVFDGTT